MRIYVLYLFVAFLIVYAQKDWFVSLCGLCLLTATMGHPDMPRSIAGIHGLNVWNVTCAAIMFAMIRGKMDRGEGTDAPRWMVFLYWAYIGLTLYAFLMTMFHVDAIRAGRLGYDLKGFVVDHLVNALKFIFPAILFFEGVRTRKRIMIALIFILLIPSYYSFIALRTRPLSVITQPGVNLRGRGRLGGRIGFHANSVAMCCVSGLYGWYGLMRARRKRWHLPVLAGLVLLNTLGLALTQSRAAYLAFLGVGVVFAVFVYRYLLVTFPIVLVVIAVALPGVVSRLLFGVGEETPSGEIVTDSVTATAGRLDYIWPPVIEDIWSSPLWGHGRMAIRLRPTLEAIKRGEGFCPGHPHCAYLEVLHDTGAIGFLIMMGVYGGAALLSAIMARDKRDILYQTTGAVGLAVIVSFLIMCVSGQSLFPRDNNQMVWCVMGVIARVWVERGKRGAGLFLYPEDYRGRFQGPPNQPVPPLGPPRGPSPWRPAGPESCPPGPYGGRR